MVAGEKAKREGSHAFKALRVRHDKPYDITLQCRTPDNVSATIPVDVHYRMRPIIHDLGEMKLEGFVMDSWTKSKGKGYIWVNFRRLPDFIPPRTGDEDGGVAGAEAGAGAGAGEKAEVPESPIYAVGSYGGMWEWMSEFLVTTVGVSRKEGSNYNLCVKEAKMKGHAVTKTFRVDPVDPYDVVVQFQTEGNVRVTIPCKHPIYIEGMQRSVAEGIDIVGFDCHGHSELWRSSIVMCLVALEK